MRRTTTVCVLLIAATSVCAAGTLSLEDRIEAQRAIERVYWEHRIWPAANPGPKPDLSEVMPESVLRARVEDTLRMSRALESVWGSPIDAARLQAELDRMTRDSRDPRMLAEIFDALGNDSTLIVETLARETLVNRLIRDRFAASLPAGGPAAATPEGAITAGLQGSESAAAGAPPLKPTFESWWSAVSDSFPAEIPEMDAVYRLDSPNAACTIDTWSPTRFEILDPRSGHTAVWTGTEMIVWGGAWASTPTNTGGRYNPATDTWTLTSTGANLPAARFTHTAVWTGTEMIVWGGNGGGVMTYLNSGGRYNPASDTWTATSTGTNLPIGRYSHTAVWTGTEMIVWGGRVTSFTTNTGGRYNPSSDTWAITSIGTNVPSARYLHTAVWTGTVMVIWGGNDGAATKTGGRYTPSTNTWQTTSTAAAAGVARQSHTAVWSGTQMIVWGGTDGSTALSTGSRYNPTANTWSAMTNTTPPAARQFHTAVWTGSQMVVWGGLTTGGSVVGTGGGRYNPTTNVWTTTSTGANLPEARSGATAVWTGTQMIVWGGMGNTAAALNSGGRYDPSADTWLGTSLGPSVPLARYLHTSVWTGTEMIVWGGYSSDYLNTGGRYIPATDSWMPTSTGANVPAGRTNHTAIWTGTEMIVWGGIGSPSFNNAGGRYNPMSDTWQPTSTGVNAPGGRRWNTAVWTGTEMIVWGGEFTNTGGRYDPAFDSWQPTSTGANVPSARYYHTAVWTGSRMIVWGGFDGSPNTNTGGLYNPATDTWAPTSTGSNVPAARQDHVAIWSGNEMIVWGGDTLFGAPFFNTGGRYDPVTDTWTATSTGANVPLARAFHTAAWTGADLIVWGGQQTNTGGRYSALSDHWLPTSLGAGVPAPRYYHNSAWTGTQMIVWGGLPLTASGGVYCGCPTPGTFYRDADGDGYGDPADTIGGCDGSIPVGYVADGTDCNDAVAAINPGESEVCNLVDDDCDGSVDNGIAAPGGVPELMETRSGTDAVLTWTVVAGADSYDVVRGPLLDLLSTGGDFTLSTGLCLGDDLPGTTVTDTLVPAAGRGTWHVVRPVNCGGAGSYDEGSGGQQGSRDAEIQAAGPACP